MARVRCSVIGENLLIWPLVSPPGLSGKFARVWIDAKQATLSKSVGASCQRMHR